MMLRRVYFSFHYGNDVLRANVVRQCEAISKQYEGGVIRFQDKSLWDETERQGNAATKRLIDEKLAGSSVTCVLIGQETWRRPWVRYEILSSFARNNGMLGINVHDIEIDPGGGLGGLLSGSPAVPGLLNQRRGIATLLGSQQTLGANPFDYLGFTVDAHTSIVTFYEHNAAWRVRDDVASTASSAIKALPATSTNGKLSDLFPVYGWKAQNGRDNIRLWIETAAAKSGR